MVRLKRYKEKTSTRSGFTKRGIYKLKESCEVIDEFTFPAGLITHVCSRYEPNQGAHGKIHANQDGTAYITFLEAGTFFI